MLHPVFNKKGFTFIELLLVISIILILGVSSGVFYSRMINVNSVANVSDQLASELRKAQMYAMMGRQNNSWGVRFASGKITLFLTGNSAFDENYSVNSNISVTGFTTVTFAKSTGIPDSAPTVTITGNGQVKTVSINAQGVILR